MGPKKRKFGIGQDVLPRTTNLARMVKWPKYVRLQRQRKTLMQRLKVPGCVAQFSHTLKPDITNQLFKVLKKHQPETKSERKNRLKTNVAEGKDTPAPSAVVVYGIKQVTQSITKKKAKMVIIASDVEPLEIVMWLPALCIKQGVPFTIVKGKARLGQICHQKQATCLALCNVAAQSKSDVDKLISSIRPEWLDCGPYKQIGGGEISAKTQAKLDAQNKVVL